MDFSLTEIQSEIQSMAARFALKEIAPLIDADEANSHFRRELFAKAGDAGLLGIALPEVDGGVGLGAQESSIALEEISYHSSSYATSMSVSSMVMAAIAKLGNESQRKKYLPALVSGKKIAAFCLTEPSYGSDASHIQTKAIKNGDHYEITGVKQFITNGMQADIFLVLARSGGPGARGISAFLIERGARGVKGGKQEKKMGMRVSPTQEIIFDQVKVSEEARVGADGKGFGSAMFALDSGRISIAAIANGISRAALDIAVKYAKEREQFGGPIMKHQGVSFMLVDMATELEASRLLTLKAAFLKDNNQDFSRAASMAKLKATDSCMRITTDAVQVLGGYGYMEEFRVERLMREAKMLQIVEGTNQIQRVVIGKSL